MDDSDDLARREAENLKAPKNYTQQFTRVVFAILFCLGLGFLVYIFYQYLQLKSEVFSSGEQQEMVSLFSEKYNEYGEHLGLFNLSQYQNFQLLDDQKTREELVLNDTALNYIQKKDILQSSLTSLVSRIIDLKKQSKEGRERMSKEGFFPQELVDILKTNATVGSIQRSLLSLEVVKFSSAMKVFSLMDVFISSLADQLGYTKSEIIQKIDNLVKRGEKDTEYYLNVCYNNPYEPLKCDKINDFDRYYKKVMKDSSFDTSFFKNLMELINSKLEYSTMPSFSITFNSFNGQSNSIGFTVEVNTLKEDEYALIQQGIKSPHIFIVSELIKLLKQSTFIVGKSIDAKDFKVNPKQITVGGVKYTVNNSVRNFDLPIQKVTDREIFDFSESYTAKIMTQESSSESSKPFGFVESQEEHSEE